MSEEPNVAADAFADRVKSHFQADGLVTKAVNELEVLVKQVKGAGTPAPVQNNEARTGDVHFNLGAATLAVIIGLALIIGVCGAVMGLNLSKQDRQDDDFRKLNTQYWLLERRLMDKEALDIIHGDKLPSDTEYGATGNLQRMQPKERENGRK